MRSISAELALISIVIPYIRILTRTLEKNENNSGIRTMKGELLKSLKSHFAGIEERKELCLATLLDPRFKDNFFLGILSGLQPKRCWLMNRVAPLLPQVKMQLKNLVPASQREHVHLKVQFYLM